jgi:hypothetical protein
MGRLRTFLSAGLMFLAFGLGTLALWSVSGSPALGQVGGVLVGMGLLAAAAGLFFRWQGWE